MSRKPARPRRAPRPGVRPRLATWLLRHAQVLFYTLGQLSRQPVASLLTASVIGIALALPAGLYVLLENAQTVTGGWDGNAHISLFLRTEVDDRTARELASRIHDLPQVAQTRLIGPAEALAEFQAGSGFRDVLQALDENPLPSVITVQPRPEYSEPRAIGELVESFKGYGEVDIVQYNLQWVKRLYAMVEIVQRGVLVLAGLLSVAVLLIVGNTIRLGIQNRRSEIEIAKLFGATDAFIRRPFLYSGLWYGLAGGLIAMVLVSVAMALLAGPVGLLAELYHSEFALQGLGATPSLAVVGAGALLGLGGSWLAVGRHLSAVEPS